MLLQGLPLLLYVFIEKYVNTLIGNCCVSGHLCPYCNVGPKAVYCCFTRTTMFTKLYAYKSYWFLPLHQVLFVYTFQFLSIIIILPEGVYTRTILFTRMFTIVILCVQ